MADAVEILVFCLQSDEQLVKVGNVAMELGLSKQMALKLAYILSQAGFLDSVRGPKGGIRLTQVSRNARLGEIVRALELQTLGQNGDTSLFEGYIDEAFLSVLDQHTLADLARRPRRRATKPSTKNALGKKKRAKPARISGASALKRRSPSNRSLRA